MAYNYAEFFAKYPEMAKLALQASKSAGDAPKLDPAMAGLYPGMVQPDPTAVKRVSPDEPGTKVGGWLKGLKEYVQGTANNPLLQSAAHPQSVGDILPMLLPGSSPGLMQLFKRAPKAAMMEVPEMDTAANDISAALAQGTPSHADHILKAIEEGKGGATYNMSQGNMAGTPNYAVSTFPERSLSSPVPFTKAKLEEYLSKNADLLNHPSGENSFGMWHNTDTGEHVADVVKTLRNKDQALAIGAHHGQEAIWDLGKGEELKVAKPGPAIVTKMPPNTAPVKLSPTEAIQAQQDLRGMEQFMPTPTPEPIYGSGGPTRMMRDLLQERILAQRAPAISGQRMVDIAGMKRAAPAPEEMLSLEHRSPVAGLTELDPAHHGTNPLLQGAERARATEEGFIPSVYMSKKGAVTDAAFKNAHTYPVEVPAKGVYDLTKDPMGLVKQAQEAAQSGTSSPITHLQQLVKKSGFKGIDDGSGTVTYFEKVPIKQMGKAATDIAERRTSPFGRPPVGVSDRRMTEMAAGVRSPLPRQAPSDAMYAELLRRLGGRGK